MQYLALIYNTEGNDDVDWETTVEQIRKQYPKAYNHKLRQLVALLACSPEFQNR